MKWTSRFYCFYVITETLEPNNSMYEEVECKYYKIIARVVTRKNTHCSTQCAAVIAQFSFRRAAPHLCRYVDVRYWRRDICQGHCPKPDLTPPTIRPCGACHSRLPHTASTRSVEFIIIVFKIIFYLYLAVLFKLFSGNTKVTF